MDQILVLHLQVEVWQQLLCGKTAFCNFSQSPVLWFFASSLGGELSVTFVIIFLISDCTIPEKTPQLSKASAGTARPHSRKV